MNVFDKDIEYTASIKDAILTWCENTALLPSDEKVRKLVQLDKLLCPILDAGALPAVLFHKQFGHIVLMGTAMYQDAKQEVHPCLYGVMHGLVNGYTENGQGLRPNQMPFTACWEISTEFAKQLQPVRKEVRRHLRLFFGVAMRKELEEMLDVPNLAAFLAQPNARAVTIQPIYRESGVLTLLPASGTAARFRWRRSGDVYLKQAKQFYEGEYKPFMVNYIDEELAEATRGVV